jgi:hypothetical protein
MLVENGNVLALGHVNTDLKQPRSCPDFVGLEQPHLIVPPSHAE